MEEPEFGMATTGRATEYVRTVGMAIFKREQTNFTEDLLSGRPSLVTCVEVQEQADLPIRDQH
jgi:hypothetical protein